MKSVQLGALKAILQVGKSTVSEFVRGEMGCFELKRERHRAMLIWAGRVVRCAEGRWVRKVYEMEWGKVGKCMKSWKAKVAELVKIWFGGGVR